jgi:hypothetical protein
MKSLDPELMESIIATRLDRFDSSNNTPERLKVRSDVTKARLAQYQSPAMPGRRDMVVYSGLRSTTSPVS